MRDGARAVEIGERAKQLSGARDPWILGTVAAAYAEAGRFPEAVTNARLALALANAQTNFEHARLLEANLKSYQAGIPIRETITTNATSAPGR